MAEDVVVSANTTAALARELGEVGRSCPPRGQRQNRDREIYCLRRYLLTLSSADLLTFPIVVRKSETPDFIFECKGTVLFGLEHTDATDPADQQEMDAASKLERPWMQGEFGGQGGDGFVGDKPEYLWLSYIVNAIQVKKQKAYRTADTRLLLYSNSNAGGHEGADDAFHIIVAHLRKNPEVIICGTKKFEVSIIKGDSLLHDVGEDAHLLPLRC